MTDQGWVPPAQYAYVDADPNSQPGSPKRIRYELVMAKMAFNEYRKGARPTEGQGIDEVGRDLGFRIHALYAQLAAAEKSEAE